MVEENIKTFMEKVEYKSPENVDGFLLNEIGLSNREVNEITWVGKMDKIREHISNVSAGEVEDLYNRYI